MFCVKNLDAEQAYRILANSTRDRSENGPVGIVIRRNALNGGPLHG